MAYNFTVPIEQKEQFFFHTKRRMWVVEHQGQTYNMQTKIGQGYTAEVFKAINRKKKAICVKIINDSFYKQTIGKSLIQNQIKILSKLKHPNLLSFIKKEQKEKLMIITQYCPGGTLYDLLKEKGKFEQQQTLTIMKQLIEGCKYMHNQGFIHRDLKPENIFLMQKNGKIIKIADFGFAVSLQDAKLLTTNVGSPLYMPYEALSEMQFSPQSDIFALGVIWYELLTGKTPFSASSQRQLKQVTKKQQFRKLQLGCSPKIKELIFKCLRYKPNERSTLSDLLAGIEGSVTLNKVKSKSFFYVASKQQIKVKDLKITKQNKDPFVNPSTINKNQRCKTQIKANDKPPSFFNKVTEVQLVKQLVNESKSIFKDLSPLSTENLIKIIKKLSITQLSFLPKSVQEKFNCLLQLYQKIITGKTEKVKTKKQAKQDQLISSLQACTTEQDFCITAFCFLRRLLRLAKSYKEFSTVLDDLSRLLNHVQAKCLAPPDKS